MDVTKSLCLNVQRHSCRLMCHNRTVLSIEDDNRKLFLLQLRSRTVPVCPSNSLTGLLLKTGALRRSPRLSDTSSSCSCVFLSSGVDITDQTRTTWSCPAAARYFPSLLNSVAHTAPAPPFNFGSGLGGISFASCKGSFSLIGVYLEPVNSCARNMRLNSLSFLLWAHTLIYRGGSLCCGMYPFAPIEEEKT